MATPHEAVSFTAIPRTESLPVVVDRINSALALIQRALSPNVGTLQRNNTTPSVAGASVWRTQSASATSITAFLGGIPEQEIVLVATDANTTIVNGVSIITKSGSNITLSNGGTRTFATVDGTVWRET